MRLVSKVMFIIKAYRYANILGAYYSDGKQLIDFKQIFEVGIKSHSAKDCNT